MTPRSRRALAESEALEADVDSPQQMENQLSQMDAARNRTASPAPVITEQEESGIAQNIIELAAATEIFDDQVTDRAKPLDFFQAVGSAGLLEQRAQVGAD